uniref:Ig-like domain-containing protein n=1 Tax=Cyprinodon variegatus TaxID=28743 RepID=A0A3Q2GQF9_CYPVA
SSNPKVINENLTAQCLMLKRFLSAVSSPADPTKIPAEPGEDIILPCRVLEKEPVDIVDWSRADLGEKEHVALYRDDQFDPDGQHLFYRNRVDLQDREMKDGNVSLVLKNVTIKDTGTYECRFNTCFCTGNKRGLEHDGGNVKKEDEGNKNKTDGGNNIGLKVGVPLGVLLSLLIGGFLVYKYRTPLCLKCKQPAATEQELQNMNTGNHQQAES